MAELPPDSDARDEIEPTPAAGPAPGMPRWVKVSLLIVVALIALFVALRLTGLGGQHGPGRHFGPGQDGGQTPSSSVGGHRPPPGMDHGG